MTRGAALPIALPLALLKAQVTHQVSEAGQAVPRADCLAILALAPRLTGDRS